MGLLGGGQAERGGRHTARAINRRGPEAVKPTADETVVIPAVGLGERLREFGGAGVQGMVDPPTVEMPVEPEMTAARVPRPPEPARNLGDFALAQQMNGMRQWLRGDGPAPPLALG